jgi:hypothetical protein
MNRNRTHDRRGATAWCGLVAAIAWPVAVPVDAEEPAAGRRPPAPARTASVLDLSADGFLVGNLVAAPPVDGGPRTTFLWQSPLFKVPIEFDVDGVERIRFARVDAPKPPATDWRIGLWGGSFASGAIEAIDADHVVLAVPGVADGRLRLRRGAIERLSRDSTAGRLIVPGGLDGWDVARGAWQEQAGRLACGQAGADAFRDVDAAPRACFDLVLSWDERPEIEVFFAAPATRPRPVAKDKKPAAAEERYRIEMTGGDLLAIRENGPASKFDLVGSMPPGAGGLHLQVYVDQVAGRMAVVLPDRESAGKALFDETLAPRKPGHLSGFGILLRGGSVRVDGLRVVPWTDPEPRLVAGGGFGGPDAVLESFDKAQGTFTFRGPEGPRQVPVAEVSMIEFPAAGDARVQPPPGTVLAAFHGGTRLAGRILDVTARAVRLDCPAVAEPLVCEFAQLAEIESLAEQSPGPLPGRPGRLEADAGRMLGCLANLGPGGGLAWQPRGGVKPVPIDADVPLRISYRGIVALGGVGIEFVRQGPAFLAAEPVAGGPAAREGRIKAGWRLLSVRLDPAAEPIDVGPLKPADLRGLLRGVAGSTVVLKVAAPSGATQDIPLVRDAKGRGDLAGASEQDVLEQALKIHEARIVHGPAPAGLATVYLKTGDSITCTVVSADPEGLRIRTDLAGEAVVPSVALRAVELVPGAGAGIPREKLNRLLFLPRMQQADPPTHMLRLPNGDYLRGKLVSLDDRVVRMDVLGVVKSLPRSEVQRLIWLAIEGDEADAKAAAAVMGGPDAGGIPTRATMTDLRYLSLAGERVDGDRLVGRSGVVGIVGVDLARCDHLDLGRAATASPPEELPYSKWKLKPAPGPRALQKPGAPDGKPRAEAPPPAAPPDAKPAAIPVLPFLEPDATGRRHLSAVGLEGRIAVLGLVDVGDRAGVGRLPRLAEIVAAVESEGVVCAAIIAGGSREEVTRAVGDLKPKPSIAVDQAGRLRAAWGDPALPACMLVDREGRVADVLPLEDGAEKIRDRVAELVAASKETRREFLSLARAHERALAGDRGCLDDLGELLTAKSEAVRRRACGQLRRLTGLWENGMPFQPDGPPDVRAGQVRQWRQWLAKEGVSAKLAFPERVDAEWDAGRPITGRTLVCRPQNGDVVELDENGKEVSTVPAGSAWGCDVTPEGNRLTGDHSGKSIVEFDANGKEVWAVRGLPGGPMSVRRLAGGTTLAALSDADLVVEYDRQGKMVWSAKVEGRPCDARRLPDGSTLVAAHRGNRIVEIDAAGKEASVVKDIEDPQTAQRLPNGHTLVAMSTPGIVREIDRDGRVVWQREGFKVPVDVQRLPDGRTLVQEQQGDLVELGPDGAEIGRTSTGGSRFLRF